MAEREARRLLEVVHQSSGRRHHDVDQTQRPPHPAPHQALLLLRQALVTVRPAHAQLRAADVRVEHAVHLVRQVARRQHDQCAHLAANTRLQRLPTAKHSSHTSVTSLHERRLTANRHTSMNLCVVIKTKHSITHF